MSYMFAAFVVVWAGIFLYILYWQRQVRDLRGELAALRASESARADSPAAGR
ncbi:MAG TPA: CcmD family protein [Chloroflexota bacterium]|nr:CcmD family protein [Chloroflexota bacterium]